MRHVGGTICPVVTPLIDDDTLDTASLLQQMDRLAGAVDGVMLLGTTGELATLQQSVADQLVDSAVERLAGRCTLVLGIGESSTARALRNLKRAVDGIDAVAACTPYYLTSTDPAALRDHFIALAEAAPVPLVLYNIPQNTHLRLPIDVVAELARHENVTGIKDSSGDTKYFSDLLALRAPGFAVLQGDEHHARSSIEGGADGLVSGLENIAPGTMRALTLAIQQRDDAEIARLVRLVDALFALTAHGSFWLSALKAAVAELTGGRGHVARPLPALTAEARAALVLDLVALELHPRQLV